MAKALTLAILAAEVADLRGCVDADAVNDIAAANKLAKADEAMTLRIDGLSADVNSLRSFVVCLRECDANDRRARSDALATFRSRLKWLLTGK